MGYSEIHEVIDLKGERERRKKSAITKTPLGMGSDFFLALLDFQRAALQSYLTSQLLLADAFMKSSAPEKLFLNKKSVLDYCGYPPLEKILSENGSRRLARYKADASDSASFPKIWREYWVCVEGRNIALYHGDGQGNGLALSMKDHHSGHFIVQGFIVLRNWKSKTLMQANQKDTLKFFDAIIPALNLQNRQDRDRKTLVSSPRAGIEASHLHLVSS